MVVSRMIERCLRTALWTVAAGFLLAFGGFVPGHVGAAHAMTLNFDTDDTGAPLSPGAFDGTTAYDAFGITISSTGTLFLFNSNCGPDFPGTPCSGNDPDLATGPTFGTDPQGNVLIIQDPDQVPPDVPNDGDEGGTITFDFDTPTTLIQIAILDNDNTFSGGVNDGRGIFLEIFQDGVPGSSEIDVPVGSDNDLEVVAFGALGIDVIQLVVNFPSSGAIASLTAVPIPAALPLLLSALAWLGWIVRRRRSGDATA